MTNITFPNTNIVNFSLVEACIEASNKYTQEQYDSWMNQAEYYQPYNPSYSKNFCIEGLRRTHSYSEALQIAFEWKDRYQKFVVRRKLFLFEVAHALGTKIYLDNKTSWLAYYMSSDNTIHLRLQFPISTLQHEIIHAMQYLTGILKVGVLPERPTWKDFPGIPLKERIPMEEKESERRWSYYCNSNSSTELPAEFVHLGANRFLKYFDSDNEANHYQTKNAILEVAAFGLEDNYYVFDDIVEKYLNFPKDRLLRKHYLLEDKQSEIAFL